MFLPMKVITQRMESQNPSRMDRTPANQNAIAYKTDSVQFYTPSVELLCACFEAIYRYPYSSTYLYNLNKPMWNPSNRRQTKLRATLKQDLATATVPVALSVPCFVFGGL
jgi:hypothetical protein